MYTSPLIDLSRLSIDEKAIREDWEILSEIRTSVRLAVETAREAKDIGSSLQARVVIETDDERVIFCLKKYHDELDSLFVVSAVEVNSTKPLKANGEMPSWHHQQELSVDGSSGKVHVLPPVQHKCGRCWRYLAGEEDGLCGRCEDVVTSSGLSGDDAKG